MPSGLEPSRFQSPKCSTAPATELANKRIPCNGKKRHLRSKVVTLLDTAEVPLLAPRKASVSDTHSFHLKPRTGWSVCLITKGGSSVERASASAHGGHPRIRKVVLMVDCRPRPGFPERFGWLKQCLAKLWSGPCWTGCSVTGSLRP